MLTDMGKKRPDDRTHPARDGGARGRRLALGVLLISALAGSAGWRFAPDFGAVLSLADARLSGSADPRIVPAPDPAPPEGPDDAGAKSPVAPSEVAQPSLAGPVLEASGKVVAKREATLSSDLTGRLAELMVAEGDRVSRGEVVARLESDSAEAQIAISRASLAVAREDTVVVEAELAAMEADLARIETLAASGVASKQALDTLRGERAVLAARLAVSKRQTGVQTQQLNAMRSDLDKTWIRAPFAGIVTEITANPGEIVSPISSGGYTQTGIATLLDPRSIVGEVNVNEQFIGKVELGQPVEMTVPAWPDQTFTGHVTLVTPVVDESTAAVKVTVGFEPVPEAIFPGMRLDVAFLGIDGQQDS